MNEKDKLVIDAFYKENGKINNFRTREKWIKDNGFYDYLVNRYHDFPENRICFTEIIYRIKNNIEKYPTCPVCGKPVTLRDTIVGYNRYCSASCCNKDPNPYKMKADPDKIVDDNVIIKECVNEKGHIHAYIKEKWLREHGLYDYLMKRYNDSSGYNETIYRIKNHIDEHPKCKHCGKPLKYYGFSYGPGGGFLTRYCNECYQKSEEFKEKVFNKMEKSFKQQGLNVKADKENKKFVYVYDVCEKHNPFKIRRQEVYRAIRRGCLEDHSNFCPICNLNSIEGVCRSILDKININNVITHERSKLYKKELDFFLKDFNIGIECNGAYWHKGIENKKILLEKYNECKKSGIKLFVFWEDEINKYKKEIENLIRLYTNNHLFSCKFEKTYLKSIDTNKIQDVFYYNINSSILKKISNKNPDNFYFGIYLEEELYGIIECNKISKFRYSIDIFFTHLHGVYDIDIEKLFLSLKLNIGCKNLKITINHDILDDSVFLNFEKLKISKEYQKLMVFNGIDRVSKKDYISGKSFICYNTKITECLF